MLNGGEDPSVTGTSAEIPADRLPDSELFRIGIVFKEPVYGHQQAGSTESALHRASLYKRLLDIREVPVNREALNRGNTPIDCRGSQYQATADDLVVKTDGAGPTLTLFAGVLGSGKSEAFPEHP